VVCSTATPTPLGAQQRRIAVDEALVLLRVHPAGHGCGFALLAHNAELLFDPGADLARAARQMFTDPGLQPFLLCRRQKRL
jgi:hypothetical protein